MDGIVFAGGWAGKCMYVMCMLSMLLLSMKSGKATFRSCVCVLYAGAVGKRKEIEYVAEVKLKR